MSGVHETTLDALASSLQAALPQRLVRRSLPRDPAGMKAALLLAGVVCVVASGGGSFANWSGREGELGQMAVKLACFVKVEDKAPEVEVEQAELALLADLLGWCQLVKADPLGDVVPLSWQQSSQLEHPYGWLVLELSVRNL